MKRIKKIVGNLIDWINYNLRFKEALLAAAIVLVIAIGYKAYAHINTTRSYEYTSTISKMYAENLGVENEIVEEESEKYKIIARMDGTDYKIINLYYKINEKIYIPLDISVGWFILIAVVVFLFDYNRKYLLFFVKKIK